MDSPSSIEEVMYLDRMNDSSAKTKVHVYITPECGLCDQIIHANEWTVACENRNRSIFFHGSVDLTSEL